MATVLIVDDEPDVLYLLTLIFESDGFDVRTAEDGQSAIEACAEGGIDIVVTDLMMPRMNGQDLIHAMKADEILREIPIVVVSARPDGVQGADAVVAKPFSSAELVERTRSLL